MTADEGHAPASHRTSWLAALGLRPDTEHVQASLRALASVLLLAWFWAIRTE